MLCFKQQGGARFLFFDVSGAEMCYDFVADAGQRVLAFADREAHVGREVNVYAR